MALSVSSAVIHIVDGRAHVCSAARYANEAVGGRLFAGIPGLAAASAERAGNPQGGAR